MRAVKKVIVLLTAVVLGCACLFTVGCGNEELLQKIDSLAGQVGELNDKLETLEKENTSLTEKLGELQTENEELSEKIEDLEAEQENQKFETANLNMIVFDRWPRHGGLRGNRIKFNHVDSEITFECTVQKGTVCISDDYNYSKDVYFKTMTCKPGDEISWTMPNDRDWGYDFIDVLIKKDDRVIGYAVIDIVIWMTYDDVKILTVMGHTPSILSMYAPIYANGEYTWGYGEIMFNKMIEQSKETVAERNKEISEIFRKHYEYYDNQEDN